MNPVLHARARQLRREQTDAERLLWSRVRDRRLLGLKFRRQYPVGPYLADFCCIEQRLIVELDGGQHVEQVLRDAARTAVLARYGYRVLRFWDHEVLMATEAVLERIVDAVGKAPHPPSPPPSGGEGQLEVVTPHKIRKAPHENTEC